MSNQRTIKLLRSICTGLLKNLVYWE